MAQNTNLQERYSALVEAKLRATSVFASLFNNRYEGDPKAGAVKVPVRNDITAAAYDIATGMSLTNPTTTYQTIVLDNDYAVNELIDGYVAEAVPDGLVAERLDSAGYALGITIDSALIAALKAGATAASTSATDEVKAIIETIAQAKAAKVNPASMWVAVSPDAFAKIYTSDMFIAVAHTENVEAGLIGSIAGIPVVESTNLSGKEFIVGNSDFCHFVNEWTVSPAINDLKDGKHIGASAVQGRQVFGYLISKPTTVFIK